MFRGLYNVWLEPVSQTGLRGYIDEKYNGFFAGSRYKSMLVIMLMLDDNANANAIGAIDAVDMLLSILRSGPASCPRYWCWTTVIERCPRSP
jgi:hypothetical protein